MKYIYLYSDGNDETTKEFDNRDEAIDYANSEWSKMSPDEKEVAGLVAVIESESPDETSDEHLEGASIWEFGAVIEVVGRKD